MDESTDNSSERRKIQYRNLIDEIETLHDNQDHDSEGPETIDHILNTVDNMLRDDNLHDKLEHTDEFVLDATLIAKANSCLNKYTHTITPVLDSYKPADFGAKIRAKLIENDNLNENQGNPPVDFTKLYDISRKLLKTCPDFLYMCGYNATVLERNVKQRKIHEKIDKNAEKAERKHVEKVVTTEKEEDSVDSTVKFLLWALKQQFKNNDYEPINYFKFAFDPDSFGQTVENCFHLSFLVRDSKVSISTDKDGIYVLSPVSSKEAKKSEEDGVNFLQHIMSLDTEVWKKANQVFNLKESPLKELKIVWEEKHQRKN